jgi:hypothetical protein
VSLSAPPPAVGGASVTTPAQAVASEPCPLCGAPLHHEQDWCLHCGAAARTRLATSPNWRGPLVALAVVLTLSLGVLAAALVALAGDGGASGSPASTALRTASAPVTPAQASTAPSTSTPGSTTAKRAPPATATARGRLGTSTSVRGFSPAAEEAALERFRRANETTAPNPGLPKIKFPKIKLHKIKLDLPKISLPSSTG